MANNNPEPIDLRIIAQKLWSNRKYFYKTLPIAFVLSCLYILSYPRYYTSDVRLAPELGSSMGGGTLGDIASSLGFDISEMQTNDAISPLLYPDLMDDNKFVTNLFGIHVVSKDGEINTNYHDYIKQYQKKPWWNYPITWLKNLLPKEDDNQEIGGDGKVNPYKLSKKENGIVEKIRKDVGIGIDKKTGVITISVTAQDPLICKTIADSLTLHLQSFITDYRTNKARIDVEHYKKLVSASKNEYVRTRQQYGAYADSHTDVVLESYRAKLNDIENDMQLKFQAYSTFNTQLQAAMAKLQERTPAFTVVKGASVPTKPSGPKRMIFVAGMMLLVALLTAFYIYTINTKS